MLNKIIKLSLALTYIIYFIALPPHMEKDYQMFVNVMRSSGSN